VQVIASSIRKGNIIKKDNQLYYVVFNRDVHPGKGTGDQLADAPDFGRGEDLPDVIAQRKTLTPSSKINFNSLLGASNGFHFMNNETF